MIHGETEEEILLKLAEHGRTIHELDGVSEIIKEEFRKFIREEDPA